MKIQSVHYIEEFIVDIDYETGEVLDKPVFYVQIQYVNGKRIKHAHRFDDADLANDFAQLVKIQLSSGMEIKPMYWIEDLPEYGSEYFQQSNGEQTLVDLEKYRD